MVNDEMASWQNGNLMKWQGDKMTWHQLQRSQIDNQRCLFLKNFFFIFHKI